MAKKTHIQITFGSIIFHEVKNNMRNQISNFMTVCIFIMQCAICRSDVDSLPTLFLNLSQWAFCWCISCCCLLYLYVGQSVRSWKINYCLDAQDIKIWCTKPILDCIPRAFRSELCCKRRWACAGGAALPRWGQSFWTMGKLDVLEDILHNDYQRVSLRI